MGQRTWTGRVVVKQESKGAGALAGVDKTLKGITTRLKGMAGFAAFAAAGVVIAGTARKISEFEKSISDLSAITGATGDNLDKLSAASKRIGATTTLSASQAAEAFKLMASAKPDLLDNIDALTATTEASVTLAEAAGLELPTATAALGEALNQFGAGAESAGKFIDVLAQGARLGSSEIDQTSEALKNSGVVARLAGLSFAQTNAVIQGFAAAGVKGSDAGTKFRSVLVKLQTQANDDFNPAIVGINDALKNLEEANLSVTEKVEIFGEKQVVSAEIMIDQRKTILDLSDSLENSLGAATDQAATRTDNLWGDMKRLQSVFEAVQINLGEAMLPTLRAVIQSFTDILAVVEKMTANDGVAEANNQFSIFDATLKTLFVTGSIIKNLFDLIGETFKGIGRIIGAVMTGSLDNVMDAVDQMGAGLNAQVDDVAETMFRTFNAEAAAQIDAANAVLAPATEQLLEEIIVEPMRRAVATAGEEAAAAAALKAKEAADKAAEAKAADLERIRQGFRSEREVIAEEWVLKLEQLALLQEEGIFSEQEANIRRIEEARKTAEAIADIEKKTLTDRQKFEAMTLTNKTKFALGEAIRLTQGTAQHSKTMFKINKAAAIANAVVNTAQGVTKSLAEYPYPVNIAFAALTAVAGLAQINAIKSQSFQGGGGGTTPSAAGSAPVINNQPFGGSGEPPLLPGATGAGQAGQQQQINININGLPDAGPVPAEMVRELIGGINEQVGDGVNLDVSPGSGS